MHSASLNIGPQMLYVFDATLSPRNSECTRLWIYAHYPHAARFLLIPFNEGLTMHTYPP